MAIAGALLVGLCLGLVLSTVNPWGRDEPTPLAVSVAPEPEGQDGQVVMPDVRGLSELDARQALADHGVGASKISITKIEHLNPDGYVAAQDPIGGTVDPAKVVLSLPVKASVPDVVGGTEDDARSTLLAMGADAEVTRRFQPGAEPGTVIKVVPKPGKPLVAVVRVVVAAPAQARPLAELAATGSCDTVSGASLDGKDVGASLSCESQEPDSDDGTFWLLKRGVERLTAVVGVDDHADTGARARLVIRADDRVLYSKIIKYGQSDRLDLDVHSVLRLTVSVTRLDDTDAAVVLGDAAVTGSADALASLDTR